MVRLSGEGGDSRPVLSDDELGKLIRWGLRDRLLGREPPDEVWLRILERVRHVSAPGHSAGRSHRSPFPLAPFVQAVVISALLLAFGLGVDRTLILPLQELSAQSTPVLHKVQISQQPTEDVLRGYMLARTQNKLPTRIGGNIR